MNTVLQHCNKREGLHAKQELDEAWRRMVLDYQQRLHAVAVKLLKAIFIGLGRDEAIIDEVAPCRWLYCVPCPQMAV